MAKPKPIPFLRLTRTSDDGRQTLGTLDVFPSADAVRPVRSFRTLERPWLNNTKRESCIPAGRTYDVVKRVSGRYGNHLHVLGTEPRELILVHVGNFVEDTVGCVVIGKGIEDLHRDGDLDVTDSRTAMVELINLIPEIGKVDARLQIVDAIHRRPPVGA